MTRLLTGLVLAGLWFGLVFYGSPSVVWLAIVAVTVGVLVEYTAMVLADHRPPARWLVVAAACLPVFGAHFGGLPLAAAGTVAGILVVIAGSVAGAPTGDPFPFLVGSVFAVVHIGLFAGHFVLLHHLAEGRLWLLFLVAVTAAADTGAYYSGTLWGRHKLCPKVSPGKTVEGLVGGLACAVLTGTVIARLGGLPASFAAAAAFVTALCGVGGDLAESIIKRGCGRKDSGHLLPGHGGLFDRVDALLTGAPVLYYGVVFFLK